MIMSEQVVSVEPAGLVLQWRRAKPSGATLPAELKRILERKIWSVKGGDEEIRRERYTLTYELDCGWIPYLEGLADAAVPGARELAQAVVDHERVTVWVGEVG